MLDRGAVKAITVPILLMSGQNTMQMNKLIDTELHRLLPKAENVVIRGATHEMWAEQPDVCRARVASFRNIERRLALASSGHVIR